MMTMPMLIATMMMVMMLIEVMKELVLPATK